jgi:hypothetical protein
MDHKYQIVSANPIVPMSVSFRNNGKLKTISVNVDFVQDRIIFDSPVNNQHDTPDEWIDTDGLEQDILNYLRPPVVESPPLPQEIRDKVAKVQAGDYQTAFNQEFPKAYNE